MSNYSDIVFSVVSHGQSNLVSSLFDDFRLLKLNQVEIILTLNIPEDESNYDFGDLNINVIRNDIPKGFGHNHNQALLKSTKKYFFVINPDIRINSIDISCLLENFYDSSVGVVAPLVINSSGLTEDNARRFPSILGVFKKLLFGINPIDYRHDFQPMAVDWVAGMFVIYRGSYFNLINGFDYSRFFMYYEDVDICRRMNFIGYSSILDPRVSVVHDAQRASRKSLRHFIWHLKSALRYFTGI